MVKKKNNDLLDYGVCSLIVAYIRRRIRYVKGVLKNPNTDYFDAFGYAEELVKLEEAEQIIKQLSLIDLEQYKIGRDEKKA